jgi:hypothetical protein
MTDKTNKGLQVYRLIEWAERLGKDIHIPVIQRGFVWKPEQIAGLWDSLLRDLPIGAFMVIPSSEGDKSKLEQENAELIDNPSNSGVMLLDGQQRGRSIQGGINLNEAPDFRVWVSNYFASENNEFKFDIKITTIEHPFGLDNSFKPLSVRARLIAFDNHGKDNPLTLLRTTPYIFKDVKNYVALDSIFKDIIAHDSKSITQDKITKILKSKFKTDDFPSLERLSIGLLKLINNRYIYAIELNHSVTEVDSESDSDIEVLFKRVGAGGTELSDLDYAYSLIKQQLPDSYSYIETLLKDKTLSKLFSSLDLIAIVIRLSCFIAKTEFNEKEYDYYNTDKPNYNKREIFKVIKKNSSIIKRILKDGHLDQNLHSVVELVKYEETVTSNGLPVELLNHIPKVLWQVLVIGLHKGQIVSLTEDNSNRFIRVMLYWLMISPKAKEAADLSKKFIKDLINQKEIEGYCFEKNIVGLICQYKRKNDRNFPTLLPSSKFFSATKIDCYSETITNHVRYGEPSESHIGYSFWGNKKLLLWLQRRYLSNLKLSEEYVVAGDVRIFDYDHIVPQAFWYDGRKPIAKILHNTLPFIAPHNTGNSIGNYQLLSFSDNRSKQSKAYKNWLVGLKDDERKSVLKNANIPESVDEEFQNTISKTNEILSPWDELSGKAFVSAVELRVCYLYELFTSIFDENENWYYFTPLDKENTL